MHAGAKASDEGTSDYLKKMIPMGRLGTAEELASAALFLLPTSAVSSLESTCQLMVFRRLDDG
jgi:NAD(P)-dependent dehydrogenase (short-subunit alcohol dehydrogenase family)